MFNWEIAKFIEQISLSLSLSCIFHKRGVRTILFANVKFWVRINLWKLDDMCLPPKFNSSLKIDTSITKTLKYKCMFRIRHQIRHISLTILMTQRWWQKNHTSINNQKKIRLQLHKSYMAWERNSLKVLLLVRRSMRCERRGARNWRPPQRFMMAGSPSNLLGHQPSPNGDPNKENLNAIGGEHHIGDHGIYLMYIYCTAHNIIQIHNNVLWDCQYSMKYSTIQVECGKYSTKYWQFHKTLLWI